VKENGGECYPMICGTGTEDYFCGSYNSEDKAEPHAPFLALPDCDGLGII